MPDVVTHNEDTFAEFQQFQDANYPAVVAYDAYGASSCSSKGKCKCINSLYSPGTSGLICGPIRG